MKNTKNKKNTSVGSFGRNAVRQQGFTLMELLLAVFIFSLVMKTIVSLFTRFVTFQKKSRGIQRNMEDAVYAMELMAKTFRTSSVVSCDNGDVTCSVPPNRVNSVEIFDYSQNQCIRFYFNSATHQIRMRSAPTNRAGCNASAIPAASETRMANNYIRNLDFRVIQSDSTSSRVGKVTISIEVCSNAACTGTENDRANMQTTVSLRDYIESNP